MTDEADIRALVRYGDVQAVWARFSALIEENEKLTEESGQVGHANLQMRQELALERSVRLDVEAALASERADFVALKARADSDNLAYKQMEQMYREAERDVDRTAKVVEAAKAVVRHAAGSAEFIPQTSLDRLEDALNALHPDLESETG